MKKHKDKKYIYNTKGFLENFNKYIGESNDLIEEKIVNEIEEINRQLKDEEENKNKCINHYSNVIDELINEFESIVINENWKGEELYRLQILYDRITKIKKELESLKFPIGSKKEFELYKMVRSFEKRVSLEIYMSKRNAILNNIDID